MSSVVDSPGVDAAEVPDEGSVKPGSPVKAYTILFNYHFIIYCNGIAKDV